MKKYENLTNHLKNGDDVQVLTFETITNIVGEPLSPVYLRGNTLKHSNSRYQMAASKADFILDSFDFNEQTMTFRRMNLYDKLVLNQRNRRRQAHRAQAREIVLDDDLGRDLDSAIVAFKERWGSVGGQYVPFLDKYNNTYDVYYHAGMEAYRAAMKRAISLNGLPQTERRRLREESCRFLANAFKNLFAMQNVNFDNFTDWAEAAATHIRSIYHDAKVMDYTYGNAQKLINVALKFVLSSNIIDYHHEVFKYCHFPVDGIIQRVIRRRFGVRPLSISWSQNDNWQEFVNYQREVRQVVLDEGYYSPMIWEATHWNF